MIKVICGRHDNLEYDVRGIAMSFYPGEEIIFGGDADNAEIELDLEKILGQDDVPKNELRKRLYRYLEKETGRTLPWGILIGIRPTKLTRQFLCQRGRFQLTHFDEKEIASAAAWMQDEYLVSEEKARLAAEIAAREIGVLARAQDAQPFSLYVGIPFCPSRCSYCSFASQPAALWEGRMGEYTDALIKELDAMSNLMNRPSSIYVGGGTPTTLPDDDFDRLLNTIWKLFGRPGIEFTVEAGRPDTITKEKLAIMKSRGVNRISINPQSMNDKTLERIGRNHTTAEIVSAYNLASDMGFDNINMDIILGLPGETPTDVESTLSEIKKLQPKSLTVHALAIKRAARLNLETEGTVMPGSGETESKLMMEAASRAASEMDLTPYYMYRQKNMAGNLENVGYAATGCECYYNIAMMEETESIIACGAGTVSKCVRETITRCDTHKDPKLYIEQIDEMIERKMKLFA